MAEKRKVWIVIGGWDWEGYDKPLKAFADRKDAEEHASELCGQYDTTKAVCLEVHESEGGESPCKSEN